MLLTPLYRNHSTGYIQLFISFGKCIYKVGPYIATLLYRNHSTDYIQLFISFGKCIYKVGSYVAYSIIQKPFNRLHSVVYIIWQVYL